MGATTLADQAAKPKTLFTNVHVFDGVHEKRIENAYVLVEGNRIKQVSAQKITATCAQSQPWDCLASEIPSSIRCKRKNRTIGNQPKSQSSKRLSEKIGG
jgi:hypothetical protein